MAKTKSTYVGLLKAFIILTIIIFVSSLLIMAAPALVIVIHLTMQIVTIITIVSTVLSALWIGLLIALLVCADQGGTAVPAKKSRIIYGLCLGFGLIATILTNVTSFVPIVAQKETIAMIMSGLLMAFSLAEFVMAIVSFIHAIKAKKALAA